MAQDLERRLREAIVGRTLPSHFQNFLPYVALCLELFRSLLRL